MMSSTRTRLALKSNTANIILFLFLKSIITGYFETQVSIVTQECCSRYHVLLHVHSTVQQRVDMLIHRSPSVMCNAAES